MWKRYNSKIHKSHISGNRYTYRIHEHLDQSSPMLDVTTHVKNCSNALSIEMDNNYNYSLLQKIHLLNKFSYECCVTLDDYVYEKWVLQYQIRYNAIAGILHIELEFEPCPIGDLSTFDNPIIVTDDQLETILSSSYSLGNENISRRSVHSISLSIDRFFITTQRLILKISKYPYLIEDKVVTDACIEMECFDHIRHEPFKSMSILNLSHNELNYLLEKLCPNQSVLSFMNKSTFQIPLS